MYREYSRYARFTGHGLNDREFMQLMRGDRGEMIRQAADRPAGPAPTITTSNSIDSRSTTMSSLSQVSANSVLPAQGSSQVYNFQQ